MKMLITTFSLLLSLTGGCSGCASVTLPGVDVVRNKTMNTTEVPANGDTWKFALPPNYAITKHDFDMSGEELVAKSLFKIGDCPIIVSVAAIPYESSDKSGPARDAATVALETDGWETVYGPEVVTLNELTGQLLVGTIDPVIVFQFTMVSGRHVYLLHCTGSAATRTRIGYRCKDMLDHFEPTSVAPTTPLVDSVPTQRGFSTAVLAP